MTRICTMCNIEKDFSKFNKHKQGKYGITPRCKECISKIKKIYSKTDKLKKYYKEYIKNNKDKLKESINKWQIKNKDKLKIKNKKYYEENKYKINKRRREWALKRSKSDIYFKLQGNLRRRLNNAIKRNSKKGSAVRDLGCSIYFFKEYLESKFKPGMTWDNYGLHGWHIDHIKPLSKFNLENREEFLEACNYKNLQPLWAKENLMKHDKYVIENER